MAKVNQCSALTMEADPDRAAADLIRQLEGQLGGQRPPLVTLFPSVMRDQRAINAAVRKVLWPGTRLLGASSGGEIDKNGIHMGGVVMSALTGDFEVGIGLGRGLTTDAIAAGSRAMAGASEQLGVRTSDLDIRRTVGLVIDDGLKHKKEELLLGVLDKNPAITLVGGGANAPEPDPSRFSGTVHVDGEVTEDAVLVALFKTNAPWAALRSHSYVPTGEKLRITKIDESCQRALEIDGKPAAQRYADLLGVSIDDLEFQKPTGFGARPTALKVGREYFLRAPWKPLPDGSIVFANLLEEDTELELMKIGDMAQMTRAFWEEELPRRVHKPQATINFHCTARDWLSRARGEFERLSATFAAAPSPVGYNVHFEIYSGFHINTTLTVLAFGESDA